MTLQDAAEHLSIPKKRLWRAVKTGQLEAVQVQKGQRWEYRVTADALEAYSRILETEDTQWSDLERVVPSETERSGTVWHETDQLGTTENDRSGTWNETERDSGTTRSRPVQSPSNGDIAHLSASPPAEVYIALIDRLSRAERRSVELEIQLRQSHRLLSENAESITEKEALAVEARAKLQAAEDSRQAEVYRLAAELETARAKEALAQEARLKVEEAESARSAQMSHLSAELESTRLQLLEAQKPKGLLSWLGLRKRRTASDISKAV